MTPITGIQGSIAADARRAPRSDASASPAARASSARALIALAPIAPGDAGLSARPQAGFLAHLIATAGKLPQTRERRRTDPADAIAAYAAAGAKPAPRGGRRLARIA